ncbi:MAG: glycosyltransferase [Patescibacteria group bacterium]|nr:glycosyltransferase [Patescibacteria group bacterium]
MQQKDIIKLSVVIPAYNGEEDLRKGVLEEIDRYLEKQDYGYEVVIVDDGSTDNTAVIVEGLAKNKKNFRLIKNPHKGKAVTVMTGLIESRGEVVVFTDIDQSTPLLEIEKFFPKFEQGFNIVIGSRSGRSGSPLIRKLASVVFSILRRIILGLPLVDTQCGFKAFDRKSIEMIFPKLLERYRNINTSGRALNADFDVEMLFLAKKKNLQIAEVKVDWHDENPQNAHLIANSLDALKGMFRVRLNDLRGKYV